MNEIITSDRKDISLIECVNSLNKLLKLRTVPTGMKLFSTKEEMEAVEKIRRPNGVFTTDQIVGQACRNG